jgi:hypothetical protein
MELPSTTEKHSEELKNFVYEGYCFEKKMSLLLHDRNTAVLISSLLLRNLNLGQVDISILKKVDNVKFLIVYECKRHAFPTRRQHSRLSKSVDYLSRVLGVAVKFKVIFAKSNKVNYSYYMKNLFLVILLSFALSFSSLSFASDSKLKVVGTMSAYGVVGGALLGTASMAFGSDSRSIAKGASLGLYAGLIFGSYVILSYEMKKRGYGESREDFYPDSKSQYEDSQSNNNLPEVEHYNLVSFKNNKELKELPLFSINFLNYNF